MSLGEDKYCGCYCFRCRLRFLFRCRCQYSCLWSRYIADHPVVDCSVSLAFGLLQCFAALATDDVKCVPACPDINVSYVRTLGFGVVSLAAAFNREYNTIIPIWCTFGEICNKEDSSEMWPEKNRLPLSLKVLLPPRQIVYNACIYSIITTLA